MDAMTRRLILLGSIYKEDPNEWVKIQIKNSTGKNLIKDLQKRGLIATKNLPNGQIEIKTIDRGRDIGQRLFNAKNKSVKIDKDDQKERDLRTEIFLNKTQRKEQEFVPLRKREISPKELGSRKRQNKNKQKEDYNLDINYSAEIADLMAARNSIEPIDHQLTMQNDPRANETNNALIAISHAASVLELGSRLSKTRRGANKGFQMGARRSINLFSPKSLKKISPEELSKRIQNASLYLQKSLTRLEDILSHENTDPRMIESIENAKTRISSLTPNQNSLEKIGFIKPKSKNLQMTL